jgi:hypothetical protein
MLTPETQETALKLSRQYSAFPGGVANKPESAFQVQVICRIAPQALVRLAGLSGTAVIVVF